MTGPEIAALIKKSHEAKQFAYCPYSKFRVGAALLAKDGTVYTGCNVENAAYPLCVCAEQTAIVKAVSEGRREFTAIAIATDVANEAIGPCGACRQALLEFGSNYDVYLTKPDYSYIKKTTLELLPLAFSPAALQNRVQEQSAVNVTVEEYTYKPSPTLTDR